MGVTVERNGGVTVIAHRNGSKMGGKSGAKVRREVSVELLLQWAYSVEKVRGSPSWGSSDGRGQGFGEMAERAGCGCHPDALIVDRVVTQLSESAAHLVRDHALACTRPDWRPGARHRFEPKIVSDKPAPEGSGFPWLGGAMWTHPDSCVCGGNTHLCDGRQVRKPPGFEAVPFVPVIERDSPAEVQAFREAWYIPWRSHLEVIRDAFRAQSHGAVLTAHRVIEALPPPTPWLSKNPLDGEIRRS